MVSATLLGGTPRTRSSTYGGCSSMLWVTSTNVSDASAASCTTRFCKFSRVGASSAEKGSSISSRSGSSARARAIAVLCRCPPEM